MPLPAGRFGMNTIEIFLSYKDLTIHDFSPLLTYTDHYLMDSTASTKSCTGLCHHELCRVEPEALEGMGGESYLSKTRSFRRSRAFAVISYSSGS